MRRVSFVHLNWDWLSKRLALDQYTEQTQELLIVFVRFYILLIPRNYNLISVQISRHLLF